MSVLSTYFHLIIYLNRKINLNYFNKMYFNFLPPLLLPGHKMFTKCVLPALFLALICLLIFPGNSSLKALYQRGISTHLDLSAGGRGWGKTWTTSLVLDLPAPAKNSFTNNPFHFEMSQPQTSRIATHRSSKTMVEAIKCYQFPGIPLRLVTVTVGCNDEGLLEVNLFQTQSSECSALSAEKCAIQM